MQGAKPVFADIQYETGNICPNSILKKITAKTKAILPVHWAGYPCDLDEIKRIADQYNLTIIEDAAHALGASYKGRPIGAISNYTAFSFQAIKHLTTGDGGALCCLSNESYNNGKIRRWFGIDRLNSNTSPLGERQYDISQVGYKFHMNDLAATLGIANIEDFPKNLRRHREIGEIYLEELKNISGLSLLNYKKDRESSYWIFTILVENRIGFIKKLQEFEVPCSVVHLRIDHNSVFGGLTPDLPNQERFNNHQIALPVHPGLTDTDINSIVKTIKTGW
jgi:perosamine synthetase